MEPGNLRDEIRSLLTTELSHVTFDDAVRNLPAELRGRRPEGVAHSPWEVIEHVRIAQWDYLEMIRNPTHVRPEFPSGYWPHEPAPPTANAWDESLAATRRLVAEMAALAKDPNTDLMARIATDDHRTNLSCMIHALDHIAYHDGELVTIRRAMGAW